MGTFIERTVAEIQRRVGPNDRVICGLSGGVDSAVVRGAAARRRSGPQVACIFVDNGLLRAGEREAVAARVRPAFKADLHVVDARERFLNALKGVTDPQEKRVRIGHVFIDVFRDEAKSIPDAQFLAQGTLYPDVIESGGDADGPAATIKTHHNVGGLPAELGLRADRAAARPVQGRGPPPGPGAGPARQPGLAAPVPRPRPGGALPGRGDRRAAGGAAPGRRDLARRAEATPGWYRQTAQAFAVLLPVQSVGVMGDGRTYENVVALRAVETDDFMTADWSRLPYELLARISTRIINEVKGVNRVVYDITSKPPATIEWE